MSSYTESMGSTSGSGSGTPINQDDNAQQPPLWRYVSKMEKMGEGGGNTKFQCNYCQNVYRGSYFRVKAHSFKSDSPTTCRDAKVS